MKKILIVLLSSIFIGLALNVQAASVTFDPGMAEFTVAPGETGRATITAHGFSSGPYSLLFSMGSGLQNGTVPIGWLSPTYVMLASRSGGTSSTTMDIAINIPPDAIAGTYTGTLLPVDMRSSEPISSPGVIIAIEVAVPQTACAGLPVLSDIEIGPQNIWAPIGRDVEVVISGAISVAEGCEVSAGYSLESNNGLIQGDIFLGADGRFAEKVKVNVSRSGNDKYGRIYNGTLYAEDMDGNRDSLSFIVTVLHDKGNKIGLLK